MSWLIAGAKRDIPGRRWISIALRSLHLVGVAGAAGGYLYQLPWVLWHPWLILAVCSGLLMVLKEVYIDGIWLLQLRGQLILLKLLLLAVTHLWWDTPQGWVFVSIVVVSGVISHAPGKVRYYSLWYRCVLTRDVWLAKHGNG